MRAHPYSGGRDKERAEAVSGAMQFRTGMPDTRNEPGPTARDITLLVMAGGGRGTYLARVT